MTCMRQRAILITGATGFVGSYLADRLQQRYPEVPMFLLARDRKGQRAEERISLSLPTFRGRVVKSDISDGDELGLVASDRETLSRYNLEVWHVAANTKFREEERKEIVLTNVTGTANLLAFAKALGARRIHYVSTAYVAGDRTGLQDGRELTAYEDETCVGQRFRNPYEESKRQAEQLVLNAARECGLQPTIYRIPITLGESGNGRVTATGFSGYYTYFSVFHAIRDTAMRNLTAYRHHGVEQHGDTLYLPLRIGGSANATLNLVCVDYLRDVIVRLAAMPDSIGKTFHVVNPDPPRWGWVVDTSLRVLQIEGVRLRTSHPRPFVQHATMADTELERKINRTLVYYDGYIHGEPRFDNRHVREVLGEIPPHPVIDEDRLGMLLRYAISKHFGRPMSSCGVGGIPETAPSPKTDAHSEDSLRMQRRMESLYMSAQVA